MIPTIKTPRSTAMLYGEFFSDFRRKGRRAGCPFAGSCNTNNRCVCLCVRLLNRTFGQSPPGNARCNNSQYYIRFPDGIKNLKAFTLELERVSGPIPVKGVARPNANYPGSKWVCKENPDTTAKEICEYEGTLTIVV